MTGAPACALGATRVVESGEKIRVDGSFFHGILYQTAPRPMAGGPTDRAAPVPENNRLDCDWAEQPVPWRAACSGTALRGIIAASCNDRSPHRASHRSPEIVERGTIRPNAPREVARERQKPRASSSAIVFADVADARPLRVPAVRAVIGMIALGVGRSATCPRRAP